ncbi:hypothetical protein [Cryobacterium tagatosivorans]|uniref:Exo-alpha-sialidase n=1 Tax=Cryobacterium tagatosivorans TaxID=1259199 RepID=A0A4V3I667_9MICO|nr:hypothetical protein [Cryobacterium tagatosivorans]TFB47782.1 hypothetical protein E3O23_14330 [Cryobacterium tagatosivorans]
MLVGLVVFVLFDIALVAFALGGPLKPASVDANPTAVENVETTPTPPPAVEPVETPVAAAVPPTRILSALDGTTAWRASTASCPRSQANPELTTDSGATWERSNASINTGASSILSINAISDSQASMVTLAADGCAPQLIGTFVAGAEWADFPDRLSGNWYVDPSDRATVHSPAGSFKAPCASVIALAPRTDADAGVLCADGTIARTSDGAAGWGKSISLPGAVNLAVSGDGYIVAAAGQKGCAGVQVLSTSEALDGSLTADGCREVTFKPGAVALSSAEGVVWLWAGDTFAQSSDGGATWG